MPESANQARRDRILDAAAKLFIHFGFDKSTVSEIAQEAAVSKGAIYLHFESKEALLEALILRELERYAEKWLALIEADPEGGTIAGMYKNSLYALTDSAFMAATFRQDGRVLGNYMRKPGNFFSAYREAQSPSERVVFVTLMQEAGAMRADVDPKVVAHIFDMQAFSLVGIHEVIPPEKAPPLDEVIEGIAELMQRALAPEGPYDPEKGKAILRELAEAGRQQYQAMQSKDEEEGP